MDATYDGIKAFQINASYNNLSNVSDTLREDVQAAISTFMNSLSINMGVSGYSKRQMNDYIPAIVFTLYDGYYIYSSTKTDSGYEYMLKPYNYYTVRYKQSDSNDVVINYTLDNYIAVYGWINGEYIVKSGYLVSNRQPVRERENLYEIVPYALTSTNAFAGIEEKEITSNMYIPTIDEYKIVTGETTDDRTEYLYPRNDIFYVDPASASKYYAESEEFTRWAEENLDWIKPSMAMRNAKKLKDLYEEDSEKYSDYEFFTNDTIKIFDFDNNNPEDSTSFFSEHKTAVIKTSIQDNLNQAITAYSQGTSSTYEFKLPKLDINEWDMLSSNICMLTFMQGVPIGTKYYNNYALVQSTRNKLYVAPESLYFIAEGNDYYHKIDCPHLTGNNITGYSNFDFLPKKLSFKDENSYYKHDELACYYCIVDRNYESTGEINNATGDVRIDSLSTDRQLAYYTALAREKYRRYKTTDNLEYPAN